jgi:protein-disulfide isomerase
MKEYDGKVKLIYKNFPLAFHKWAEPAGIGAEGAFQQDPASFWTMYDYYFNNQQQLTPENIKDKSIEALAGSKVDQAKWTTCYDSKATLDQVKKDMTDGQSVGVTGTPAFFINGRRISGAQPFENFKAIIDDELQRGS